MNGLYKDILKKARDYRDSSAEMLSQMIRIPSLSGSEREVIEFISSSLSNIGFDEVRTDGLGNLVCRIGNGPRILAIDAHIDTVDVGLVEQWEYEPFSGKIFNGKVLGRGACDQKAGAASMITAGKILKEITYDGKFTIYLTFTVMEEDCDGLCWDYLITEEHLKPEFVVITEPTNLGLYRGHRGRMEIELTVKGVSAHGSAPERGENAIYKASKICLGIMDLNERLFQDDFLGKGTVAVTNIISDSPSLCAIPDRCDIHLDRRLTWGENKESALDEIKAIVGPDVEISVPIYDKKSYKGTMFHAEKYFPTWKLDRGHPLLKAGAECACLVLDTPPRIDKWTFSTNGVSICGRHGIPVIGFGPGDESLAHAPNEFVEIDQLVAASGFYALLPYILEKSV